MLRKLRSKILLVLIAAFMMAFLLPNSLVAKAAVITDINTGLMFDISTGTITGYTGNAISLVIPKTIEGVLVTNIGNYAFYSAALSSVTIPDSIASIGVSAFGNCKKLTNIVIPDSVISIGESAFLSCSSLKSVSIPDSGTSIGESAFLGCSSLENVNISDGVISIEDCTFLGCSSLASVNIPDSVIDIGDSAFGLCSSNLTFHCISGSYAQQYAYAKSYRLSTFDADDPNATVVESNITADTVWTADHSPYHLQKDIQIAPNITLTIEPGVRVVGDGHKILNYGYVSSIGTSEQPISFEFTEIGACNSSNLPCTYDLEFVSMVGGQLLPTSQSSHCNLKILNSHFKDLDLKSYSYSYIWYPVNEVEIAYNVFDSTGGLSIGSYYNVNIHNNAFIDIDNNGNPRQSVIESWANYNNSATIVRNNSFFDSNGIILRDSYSNGNMVGINNFWNTVDTNTIQAAIYDYTKDYSVTHTISYLPILTSPDVNTPNIVSFDSQGGKAVPRQTTVFKDIISESPNTSRTGYTLTGWYDSPTSGNQIIFPYTITGNTTLYARWTPNDYTITFNSNGGSAVASIKAAYGSIVTVPAPPTKAGYTFSGWSPAFPSNMPVNGVKLTAQWEPNNYTITFNSNGGSVVASIEAVYGSALTVPTPPTKAGYTFSGWNPAFPSTMPVNGLNLTARWVPNNYTITFNSSGGSAVASSKAAYGSTLSVPAAPTRTGYSFAGWFKQAACITPWNFATDKVTANTMLYAKWTATCTVIFNSQGGSAVASKTVNIYTSITAPTAPIRMGYTFGGWYRQAACTIAWNFIIDDVTANTTLFAKWTANKYTIAATSNNTAWGTGAGGGSIAYGTLVTLRATPKDAYRFVRWLEGTTSVSTSASYTFTVSKARALKAEFATIGTPSVKAASAGYNGINLTWTAIAGAQGYEVSRYDPATKLYQVMATVATTSYTNTGLTTGKAYSYKVRAKCVAGSTTTYGSYSTVISAKPVPATPTAKVIRSSATSITVSWNVIQGAMGYEVYIATASGGTYTLVKSLTTLSWTNTRLVTGKTYYYKVRAYRVVGVAKVYGLYSGVVYAKP